jgi:hypothetical protein
VSKRVGLLKRLDDIAEAVLSSAALQPPVDPRIIAAWGLHAFWTPSGTPTGVGGATSFLKSGASKGMVP